MKLYRLLNISFYYAAPLVISYTLFFRDQPTATKLSISGLVLGVLLFLTYYKKFKDYQKAQLQAHENARNLGQVSQTVNFVILAGLNFGFTIIPFVLILLVDSALRSYSGNATLAISFLLLSFGVAEMFGVLYHTSEQAKIQEKLAEKTKADNERLAEVIKEKL